MRDMLQFYIDGQWVDPLTPNPFDVINPATEEVCIDHLAGRTQHFIRQFPPCMIGPK